MAPGSSTGLAGGTTLHKKNRSAQAVCASCLHVHDGTTGEGDRNPEGSHSSAHPRAASATGPNPWEHTEDATKPREKRTLQFKYAGTRRASKFFCAVLLRHSNPKLESASPPLFERKTLRGRHFWMQSSDSINESEHKTTHAQ